MANKITPQVVLDNFLGAVNILAGLATPFLRSRRLTWGATRAEVLRPLPGDELIRNPKWTATHAVTIRAPVAVVWPWVVQIGQGRGGLYSYEILENLVGCNVENADRVLPQYQTLRPGDMINIHPKAPGIPVARVEPQCYLLLYGDSRHTPPGQKPVVPKGQYNAYSWLLFLDERDNGTTRLISRTRSDYSAGMRLWFGPLFVEPISFVMERRMLLGIKQRAEKAMRAARQLVAQL